jgi:phage shock protein A
MLIKGSSKRKRTKAELEEVKQEKEALRGEIRDYFMDVKCLKQKHAEMLAFLQNEQNQPQVQQQMGNQPNNGGQMMQFNI